LISIQTEDFSPEEIMNAMKAPEAGAIVSFLGVVREDPAVTSGLDVETYEEMALEKLTEVAEGARERFEIEEISIVHRVGKLRIGENIAFIAVSSVHRSSAFAAARWAIDELKKGVPLWKKEV
jgi:molybdopterin synthase catalytic subunit